MARKQRDSKRVIEVKSSQPAPTHIIDRLFALPRFGRMLIAVVPALALTFIISPLVDEFYLRYFYTPQTAELPAWITAGFATAMYFAGWYFLVGHAGDELILRRETRWYLFVSIVIVVLAVVWFVLLAVMNVSVSTS